MRNAGLEEAQAGIEIAGRNINSLRYADDITLMAENEEELKRLLMKVKIQFSSVAQSYPTPCNPMNHRHARPPCPLPTPKVHPNPCLSSR